MSKLAAWGDITIIDQTDIGKLSTYITSSLPLQQIYDPNTTAKYSPDWGQTNLELTPTVFFNDKQLALTASGLALSWQRQVGSGSLTDLVTGETVRNGVLTVSKNILAAGQTITYICSFSYIDPNTNDVSIESKSQISLSCISNAQELSDCNITGDTTFKYNGEGKLLGSDSIVLTASLSNATIKQWQYKNADGVFTVYPGSSNQVTLTVKATDDVFINDLATIKLVTSDGNLYDIHQISKLRDGAAGSSTFTCNLSNDTQSIPCSATGELYSTSLNGCTTTIQVLKGATDDTSNWNITATPSAGVSGTFNTKTYTYTVTGITVDSGYVEFVCAKSGHTTITKRFSMNKDRSGSDGNSAVFRTINTDVGYLTLNKNEEFVPAGVTFSATMIVGESSPSVLSGRFKIYESADGATYVLKYTSSSDESSKFYIPSSNVIKTIKCELYQAGGTSKLLDTQTITVVSDGSDGEAGKDGQGAINVVMGNVAESIACTTNGYVIEAKDIEIPYDCYQGVTRIDGKASVATPLPSGITLKSNKNATSGAGGMIILSVEKGANLFNALSGDITITFVTGGVTSVHKFTLTKNLQSKSGANAVIFQIYAPYGDVIKKDVALETVNNVLLETRLTDGGVVIDSMDANVVLVDESNSVLTDENGIALTDTGASTITYQWAIYTGTGYDNIATATASSLTVTTDMVDSLAYIRCVATYCGNTYVAYWCVTDRSDPLRCEPFSTLGSQLVNGKGIGAIYARAYQNNVEADELKTDIFDTKAPSDAREGDFYYHIDETTKSVVLKKFVANSWKDAEGDDLPRGDYKWYRRDSMGNVTDTTKPFAVGKAIYLDHTVVDVKSIFACHVEIDV